MKKILSIIAILFLLTNSGFANDVDINAFMDGYGKEIQKSIKENLDYKGEENTMTTVTYQINPDGSVSDIKIEKSGGEAYDKAVINAVQKASPFKPFPKEINLAYITMTSGFQHKVERYQTARMSIMPVEPTADMQRIYKQYMERVSRYMFERTPTTYNYIPKEPEIKCKITKDGYVKDFQVSQSSGIPEYDRKIVEIFSGMKFDPFPPELNMYDELPFSMRIYKQMRTVPAFGNPSMMFR